MSHIVPSKGWRTISKREPVNAVDVRWRGFGRSGNVPDEKCIPASNPSATAAAPAGKLKQKVNYERVFHSGRYTRSDAPGGVKKCADICRIHNVSSSVETLIQKLNDGGSLESWWHTGIDAP